MKLDLRPHPVFAAFLLLIVSLVPVMILKDISPSNELRYLSIAEEALEEGHVFAFSNHGEPYSDKPPLYLWLVMLSRLVSGEYNFFLLSLFSFIPALVIIGVMDKWLMLVSAQTTIRFSWTDRFAAAVMLGTSAMFVGTAIILRMDMLMTMFIVLAMFTFYKMYRNIGRPALNGLLLPVFIFLALFTKGPVGLLMPIVSIFIFLLFSGKPGETGKYLGFRTWGVLVLLCGLWFLGVWLEGGKEYLSDLLFHQTYDRAVDAFHHKEPVWYYLTAILYVAAPYSLILLYMIFARHSRQVYVTDAGRLFIVCFASTFVMLSLFSSKLSVYLLPVLPFMTYAAILTGKDMRTGFMIRITAGLPAVLLMLVALAVCTYPLYAGSIPEDIFPQYIHDLAVTPHAYLASAVLLAGAAVSFYALSGNRAWTLSVSSTAVSLLVAVIILTPLVPEVNDYIGYRNVSRLAMELKKASGVSGYSTYDLRAGENMDVLVDEKVTAYNAADDFYYADISDSVLIARTSKLRKNPKLLSKTAGLHGIRSGEFTVFVVPPAKD